MRHKLPKFKYYLVSEYGEQTFRPHYHCLIFFREAVNFDKIQDVINQTWKKGFIYIGSIEQASIHYCTHHHITKGLTPDGLNPTFTLMSRRPAIAYDYIEQRGNYHRQSPELSYVTYDGGQKQVLPRYLKTKIYPKEDLEKIALLCTPQSIVPIKEYFSRNPKHTQKDYAHYRKMFVTQQLTKNIKSKKYKL